MALTPLAPLEFAPPHPALHLPKEIWHVVLEYDPRLGFSCKGLCSLAYSYFFLRHLATTTVPPRALRATPIDPNFQRLALALLLPPQEPMIPFTPPPILTCLAMLTNETAASYLSGPRLAFTLSRQMQKLPRIPLNLLQPMPLETLVPTLLQLPPELANPFIMTLTLHAQEIPFEGRNSLGHLLVQVVDQRNFSTTQVPAILSLLSAIGFHRQKETIPISGGYGLEVACKKIASLFCFGDNPTAIRLTMIKHCLGFLNPSMISPQIISFALQLAADEGDFPFAQTLLTHPNAKEIPAAAPLVEDPSNSESLVCTDLADLIRRAAMRGHYCIVEILLAHPNAVEISAIDMGFPIYEAASAGHLDILKLLWKHPKAMEIAANGLPMDTCGSLGAALVLASGHGHLRVVEFLLTHPKADEISIDGVTSINHAREKAAWKRHIDIVAVLDAFVAGRTATAVAAT